MTVTTHDRHVGTDDRGVWRPVGDRRRSGGALVAVMKPVDLGDCDDPPGRDRLYLAPTREVR
jgi:hypothetical protein